LNRARARRTPRCGERLEETGLRVRATGIIGTRVHPVTGVLIVYMAAEVAAADAVAAGDELDVVRWVQEADGRYGRRCAEHLQQALEA
jgi:NADH pyrophosphatase NudC (nudix superfamily)